MANRPKGYGMTAELARKKDGKYDADLATEAAQWIEDVVAEGEIFTGSRPLSMNDFAEPLKSGVVLCKLVNVIKPGSVKKFNESKMAFKMMENINHFLTAAENMGCHKMDLFQTVDLYEQDNVPQVVNAIFAVGRKSQKFYDGPRLGPEEATENKRSFTDEQLRAGEGVIGLQAGSNKGASQAGQSFGKNRAIID